MKFLNNLSGHVSGPRIVPISIGGQEASVEAAYDPNFWLFGYTRVRIQGISSPITARFEYIIPFSDARNKAYYIIETPPLNAFETDTSPVSNSFIEIVDKQEFQISNGQYITVSLDGPATGNGNDYAQLVLDCRGYAPNDNEIFAHNIGTYDLNFYY